MGGGKESIVSKERLLLIIQLFYSFHNGIVPANQIGKERAISPSRTATKPSNNWYFWKQAFFTVFFSLYLRHEGEPSAGGSWVHGVYIYIYSVSVPEIHTPKSFNSKQTTAAHCVCMYVEASLLWWWFIRGYGMCSSGQTIKKSFQATFHYLNKTRNLPFSIDGKPKLDSTNAASWDPF